MVCNLVQYACQPPICVLVLYLLFYLTYTMYINSWGENNTLSTWGRRDHTCRNWYQFLMRIFCFIVDKMAEDVSYHHINCPFIIHWHKSFVSFGSFVHEKKFHFQKVVVEKTAMVRELDYFGGGNGILIQVLARSRNHHH